MLVTLLQFMLASVVQAGILATLLDISTSIGTGEIGTALLLGGWALIAADAEAPRRTLPAPPPVWPAPSGAPTIPASAWPAPSGPPVLPV